MTSNTEILIQLNPQFSNLDWLQCRLLHYTQYLSCFCLFLWFTSSCKSRIYLSRDLLTQQSESFYSLYFTHFWKAVQQEVREQAVVNSSQCLNESVQSITAPSCMSCSPGRGDNELWVFVGDQVTLVFWVLHCHLMAENEREVKSIRREEWWEAQKVVMEEEMIGETSEFWSVTC